MSSHDLRQELIAASKESGLPPARHLPLEEECRRARHLADFVEAHWFFIRKTWIPNDTPQRLRTLAELLEEAARAIVPQASPRESEVRAILDEVQRVERVLDFVVNRHPRYLKLVEKYRRAVRRRGRGVRDLNTRVAELIRCAGTIAHQEGGLPIVTEADLEALSTRSWRLARRPKRPNRHAMEARDALRRLLRKEMERAQVAARAVLAKDVAEAICYERRPERRVSQARADEVGVVAPKADLVPEPVSAVAPRAEVVPEQPAPSAPASPGGVQMDVVGLMEFIVNAHRAQQDAMARQRSVPPVEAYGPMHLGTLVSDLDARMREELGQPPVPPAAASVAKRGLRAEARPLRSSGRAPQVAEAATARPITGAPSHTSEG